MIDYSFSNMLEIEERQLKSRKVVDGENVSNG